MIQEFNTRKLQNPQFLQFFQQALDFIGGYATVAAAVAAALAALQTLVTRIDDLFRTDATSPLSDDLVALDLERDRYIGGIAKICDGYRDSPDSDERQMAEALLHSISVYGTATQIRRQEYNSETASIKSMLQDWTANVTLATAITTLHLGGWKAALLSANGTFNDTYMSRTGQMAASDTPDTIKGKREETMDAWETLRQQINANQILAADKAPWNTVIGQLNSLLDQYRNMFLARAGRNAANDNEAPPPQKFPGS